MERFSGPRRDYPAKCAQCGTSTTVPFKPTGERPVLCRDCFGGARAGGRPSGPPRERLPDVEVTCSECGIETTVPFKPTGDRPVLCRDCFQAKRPARSDRPDRSGDRRIPGETFTADCGRCGGTATVPFKPSGDRPILCANCFQGKGSTREFSKSPGGFERRMPQGDRQMFTANCSTCGNEAKVPFQPSPGRAVYCENCFRH